MSRNAAPRPRARSAAHRPSPRAAAAARLRAGVATALIGAGLACTSATAPEASDAPAPAGDAREHRLSACTGPASALPASIAAALPPEGAARTSDAAWAELARRVPGGFAGVMYDLVPAGGTAPRANGRPILMLTDPSRAAEAKAALAPHLPGFDVAGAEVRQVRWNFAQLYDWYRHLANVVWRERGVTMSDIDEAANRLVYGGEDEAARDRIAQRLSALALPCDLVLVRVVPPAQTRPLR